MCGIAGVLNFDSSQVKPEIIKAMNDSIRHRGPDDEGIYVSGPLGLGHRRLAIIDLSAAGRQPMANEDETVWITYNGEIYNYTDIRSELIKKRHKFKSATDAEVIIHAYEEWGVDCLRYFNGMFAFALWDANKRCLWLVRDRLGVKPIFYYYSSERFIFGSEIKAILCGPGVERKINCEALDYYLALNYTPAPLTLFADIRQLLPGHYLMVSEAGRLDDAQYWDLIFNEEKDLGESFYIGQFNNLLEDAVRARLKSDVPFGVLLSGGIDSSTVAYHMSYNTQKPIMTFSVGFEESSYNELSHARKVAHSIGAKHYERIVTADAAEMLPKLVWHAEEPTADSSMLAIYYIADLAREHVKMVLTGDGADEVLAGYGTYQAYMMSKIFRFIPGFLRRHILTPLVNTLPVSDTKVSWEFKLKRFVRGADLPFEDAHASWRMIFNKETRGRLLAPLFNATSTKVDVVDLYREMFSRTNARHPLNRMLYVDTRFYLPNDMLVKIDRATMAHGLEARQPFLDYRLVEFLATVPPDLKLKNWRHKKYLLKKSMKEKLPAKIIWRKKEGFNIPNSLWMKNKLKPFVMDMLSAERIKEMGILDVKTVNTVLEDHFAQKVDNSHQIWCLLVLVLWWEQFIKHN